MVIGKLHKSYCFPGALFFFILFAGTYTFCFLIIEKGNDIRIRVEHGSIHSMSSSFSRKRKKCYLKKREKKIMKLPTVFRRLQ